MFKSLLFIVSFWQHSFLIDMWKLVITPVSFYFFASKFYFFYFVAYVLLCSEYTPRLIKKLEGIKVLFLVKLWPHVPKRICYFSWLLLLLFYFGCVICDSRLKRLLLGWCIQRVLMVLIGCFLYVSFYVSLFWPLISLMCLSHAESGSVFIFGEGPADKLVSERIAFSLFSPFQFKWLTTSDGCSTNLSDPSPPSPSVMTNNLLMEKNSRVFKV